MIRGAGVRLAALLACSMVACGDGAGHGAGRGAGFDPRAAALRDPQARTVPASMASCARCHAEQVEQFLGHGMAHSLGLLDHAPRGVVTSGSERYRFVSDEGGVRLVWERPDGGVRTQRVVGRYGAGVLDVSYIGSELDDTGRPTGHLTFLPVEAVTGHGTTVSPFEAAHPGTGFGQPVDVQCLECHTTDDPAALPGAAVDVVDPESGRVWPANLLGAEAFEQLAALSCDACHGEVARHAELKAASLASGEPSPELGLERLGDLPAPSQRDVCSRCHLQGEGRLELAPVARGGPQPDDLLARRPVLVAGEPDDAFRFVGQLERLALSACFTAPEGLTCTSCHEPHQAVAAQGTASFDGRCLACHPGDEACARSPALTVRDVTGEAARSDQGCVDCHVRRSQPFDLPHVRTADHWVRRVIPRPTTAPMQGTGPGPLRVFDDGRLAERLATPAGRRWEAGLVAVIDSRRGRIAEAHEVLAGFPEPGRAAATVPLPGSGLPPLLSNSEWHHQRALVLELVGAPDQAMAAYADALSLETGHPQARINRGLLRFEAGDMTGALADAEALVARFPRAHTPWNLRSLVSASEGWETPLQQALFESVARWPGDPATWHELGRALLHGGMTPSAVTALERAAAMAPSRPGLADDLRAAREALAREG